VVQVNGSGGGGKKEKEKENKKVHLQSLAEHGSRIQLAV